MRTTHTVYTHKGGKRVNDVSEQYKVMDVSICNWHCDISICYLCHPQDWNTCQYFILAPPKIAAAKAKAKKVALQMAIES